MQTSPAGKSLIQSFEACKLEAYPDPALGWQMPTIGWGDTGPDVHRGMVITQEDADRRFEHKLACFEGIVNQWVDAPLTQGQFDALVSIVYNVGPGLPNHRDGIIWLASGQHSTLLKCLLNRQYSAAAAEFPKWDKPVNLPGILRRRKAEMAMFLGAA